MSAPVRIDLNDVSSFPGRRVEGWKWTDLRRWLREAPVAAPAVLSSASHVDDFSGPFSQLTEQASVALEESDFAPGMPSASRQVFVNGRDWTGAHMVTRYAPRAGQAPTEGPNLYELTFVGQGGGGWQTSVGVTVGEGEHLLLLETYRGQDACIGNASLNVAVLEGGRLERIVLTDDSDEEILISRADITLSQNAAFTQTVLTTGGKLQRLETHVSHPGEGTDVRMDGVYLLTGSRHADMTSVVSHSGLNGVTSQLTKGVVRDQARGVFQGKIIVQRGADGTDARMGHHALILSERGEVDAKPELEIYADDVQCAHGNTVGALDESALFYMQQRGLSADEARALLVQAFLIEVVDRIDHEGARERVREWLTARL